jgi:hypothetical protein
VKLDTYTTHVVVDARTLKNVKMDIYSIHSDLDARTLTNVNCMVNACAVKMKLVLTLLEVIDAEEFERYNLNNLYCI